MIDINRQNALKALLSKAEKQGYLTFDNIIDSSDVYNLPVDDFDWLSDNITTRGILIYDEEPTSTDASLDEEYDDYAQSDYEKMYSRIIEIDDSLEYFVTCVKKIIPPQRGELSRLKYQVLEGNKHARKRLIEMHLRQALKIALSRSESYDIDIGDAIEDACVGLVIASDKYDPDSNGPFGPYAAMWMIQSLSRQQETRRPLIYYPVHQKEIIFQAYMILKENCLIGEMGVYDERDAKQILFENMELTNEQADMVIKALTPLESLDTYIAIQFDDDYETDTESGLVYKSYPSTLIGENDIDEKMARTEIYDELHRVIKMLKPREQDVIKKRFGMSGEEQTLEEIGEGMNITRERVRQIEKKALIILRHPSRSKNLRKMYND